MARPVQEVKVYGVQDRRSRSEATLPWVVRYTIDGRHRSKSHRTRVEAERFRGLLLRAVQSGDRFNVATGEPESWQVPLADTGVHEWSRRWLAEQWQEWQPRTRGSNAEALSRFVVLAVEPVAQVPEGLRIYLQTSLRPDKSDMRIRAYEDWMTKNCLPVGELNRGRVATIDRQLAVRLDGLPMAATTANGNRTVARACVHAAVDAGAISVDPWPRRSQARAQRKVARKKRVDVHSLPNPVVMARAIDAIVTSQPGSRTYRVMTAVA